LQQPQCVLAFDAVVVADQIRVETTPQANRAGQSNARKSVCIPIFRSPVDTSISANRSKGHHLENGNPTKHPTNRRMLAGFSHLFVRQYLESEMTAS
jgi:hypothetical protein